MSARLLSALVSASALDVPITGIAADSRRVQPGFLFVALPGVKANGKAFISEAVAKGAAAVVCEGHCDAGSVPCIAVPNARLALTRAAAAFYDAQPLHIAAVTGTDGKTSTAEFFRQLAEKAGRRAASLGTLGTLGHNRAEFAAATRTTPDPIRLHETLAALAADGYSHVCMEASSHGLDQFRLDGVRVRAAAFTNLTRDHLDYHGTDAAYFAAKARLFSEVLDAGGIALLNADDPRSETLAELCKRRAIRVLTYGRAGHEFAILEATPTPDGQRARIRVLGREHALNLPHVGAFQLYNMLAALGLLHALGEDAQKLASLLPQLSGVPGRLERVGLHSSAAIYVDYAHTPAALANVLQTLRPHTQGRLIVVFGCGGERDKGKRPQMGEAAARLADVAIITDDNPRGEDPAHIRREVLMGAKGSADVKEIADRRAAIYGAVAMLTVGDMLLLAGKGHENTQIIGAVEHPFDDAAVAREAMGDNG